MTASVKVVDGLSVVHGIPLGEEQGIGALTLVFAFRYGKAIIVAPLSNAGAPLATALLSLAVLGVVPGPLKSLGIGLALLASLLLAIEPDAKDEEAVLAE